MGDTFCTVGTGKKKGGRAVEREVVLRANQRFAGDDRTKIPEFQLLTDTFFSTHAIKGLLNRL